MSNVEFYGCYDYTEEWYLIEMLIDEDASEIDWSAFATPEEGLDPKDWQAVYMEQYLSNAAEEFYAQIGYDQMLSGYQNVLSGMVGPTKIMISGDTLQVQDYSKYNWTMFDPKAKKARHDTVFPDEKQKAFSLGVQMVKEPWK